MITTAPLWTADDAVKATGGSTSARWCATGISIDSRTINKGDLFVALPGPNFDGHDYVAAAFAQGAAAAMATRRPADMAAEAPVLIVKDTHAALQDLGRARRRQTQAPMIAVTGSVGKTGTKEMMALALGTRGHCHASRASFNNDIGVPLTLARMPLAADYGVFELGMNHAGELAQLTRQVRPHIAVITTIAATHLGHFANVDAICDAKAEIFDGVLPNGTAILNQDNHYFERLRAAAASAGIERIVGFGSDRACAVRLDDYQPQAGANSVSAHIFGRPVRYRLAVDGRHWAINSLAVLACVAVLDGDVDQAASALAAMTAPSGRGARHLVPVGEGDVTVVDESYNASPASMRAALMVLASTQPSTSGRRIAVLGDMLELGNDSRALHAALADDVSAANVDVLFTVGADMCALRNTIDPAKRGEHATRSEDLISVVRESLRPGDVVMIKGSAGSRMGVIVEALLSSPNARDSGATDAAKSHAPQQTSAAPAKTAVNPP